MAISFISRKDIKNKFTRYFYPMLFLHSAPSYLSALHPRKTKWPISAPGPSAPITGRFRTVRENAVSYIPSELITSRLTLFLLLHRRRRCVIRNEECATFNFPSSVEILLSFVKRKETWKIDSETKQIAKATVKVLRHIIPIWK